MKTCPDCGRDISDRGYRAERCASCAKKHRIRSIVARRKERMETDTAFREKWTQYERDRCAAQQERRNSQPRQLREAVAYRVVDDPLDYVDGGFAPGAMFSAEEVRYMVKFRCLTPGTLLEQRGQKYKYTGGKLCAL